MAHYKSNTVKVCILELAKTIIHRLLILTRNCIGSNCCLLTCNCATRRLYLYV